MSGKKHKALFLDVDGTICFLAKKHGFKVSGFRKGKAMANHTSYRREKKWKVRYLPPERLENGIVIIAQETINHIQRLKKQGWLIVLVTGARICTVQKRSFLLGFADYIVTEHGGEIYSKMNGNPDVNWKKRIKKEALELPEIKRELEKAGFKCETNKRNTSIMLRWKENAKNLKELYQIENNPIIRRFPMKVVRNLDNICIIPKSSGKGEAVRYLKEKRKLTRSIAIGDDWNDLPLFGAVDKSYLLTHADIKVKQKVQKMSKKILTSKYKYIQGINHILKEQI